jgi:membrane protein YdbS with pleckstrin-like domain
MGAVVWSGRPYMRKTVVKFILLFAAVTLLLSPLWAALPLLYAVFALISAVVFVLHYSWKSGHAYYIRENSVLITQSWVFGGYQREITPDIIQDVHVQQGLLARAFRCGSVVFTTRTGLEVGYMAYEAGPRILRLIVARPVLMRSSYNAFLDVPHPEQARELLLQKLIVWREAYQQQRIVEAQREIVSAQQRVATALEKGIEVKPVGKAEEVKPFSIAGELEKLKKLLDEGAITKEEYEKLKKRLLEEYTGTAA